MGDDKIDWERVKKSVPQFAHDCENCAFLGVGDGQDLYWCDQGSTSTSSIWTVVARYGNDGPDYSSGAKFAKPGGNIALYEAKLRAIRKGLIKEDE